MLPRLESDLKEAMKAGQKRRVSTLRLLLAGIKNERIQLQREPTPAEIEAVIRRAVKQRKDSIEQYAKGGRTDLVDAEKEELVILEAYLPKSLSEGELEDAVRRIIDEKELTAAKDVGLVMKELMSREEFKGRVDGKKAQEIARRLLP
jgi:uncharacterized protein YqeY